MINTALIGTWHVHFDGYAREAAANGNCKFTALWDPCEEAGKKAAEKYNCEFVNDYDTLLARRDVDAVMVCTSTDLHKDVIIKAANAGKHIFTEKVLCFNEADALEVARAVKESGVKFCISFPWKSRSDFLWLKETVDSGILGESDRQLERTDDACRGRKQRADDLVADVGFDFEKRIPIEHLQAFDAVFLAALAELVELGELFGIGADGQGADALEGHVQFPAHRVHHAVALDVELCFQRPVLRVIARVDDRAVRLAGTCADVLILFDH